jgi:cysteine synthase A
MPDTMLHTIGDTPVVELARIVPAGAARVLVKLEGANPTGSMKDRMALAMIEAAERSGRLKAGGRVVEFTGGSTGTSLAMVCAAKGYPLSIVTSNAASLEKRNHMKALGAELTVLHTEGGRLTAQLFADMRQATEKIVRETGAFWTDQFNNRHQEDGYERLAQELWFQSEGRIDAFVQVVGTCGSLRGVATTLRQIRPNIHVLAVEPEESAVLSGGATGAHRIEGVGTGSVPPLWEHGLADAIDRVSTAEAIVMAQRLAREEAIFAGTSSGANVVAAVRLAERLGAGATVTTLAVDHGLKYLSTEVYQ